MFRFSNEWNFPLCPSIVAFDMLIWKARLSRCITYTGRSTRGQYLSSIFTNIFCYFHNDLSSIFTNICLYFYNYLNFTFGVICFLFSQIFMWIYSEQYTEHRMQPWKPNLQCYRFMPNTKSEAKNPITSSWNFSVECRNMQIIHILYKKGKSPLNPKVLCYTFKPIFMVHVLLWGDTCLKRKERGMQVILCFNKARRRYLQI